eukprot:gene5177-5828_t
MNLSDDAVPKTMQQARVTLIDHCFSGYVDSKQNGRCMKKTGTQSRFSFAKFFHHQGGAYDVMTSHSDQMTLYDEAMELVGNFCCTEAFLADRLQ